MNDTRKRLIYISSLSSITSSLITHPIDVIKVRFQNNIKKDNNILSLIKNTNRSFLYKGIGASILRNGTFVSTKMYAYNYLKKEYSLHNFGTKFFCGCTSGAIGATVGTPFDTVMVNMQSDPKINSSILTTVRRIYDTNGIYGFWKGYNYTLSRGIVVTACQFSVFEQLKQELTENNLNETTRFLLSSVTSSIITSIVSNPVDLCKTRKMNDIYPNTIVDICKKEGVINLWKGLVPNIMRQIPMNIIRFGCFDVFSKNL